MSSTGQMKTNAHERDLLLHQNVFLRTNISIQVLFSPVNVLFGSVNSVFFFITLILKGDQTRFLPLMNPCDTLNNII